MKEFQKSNLKPAPFVALMMPSRQPDTRLEETDAIVLAAIRAGAHARGHAATLRRALRDNARLFADFNHFSRLCLGDLRDAFIEDRQAHTRLAKNRRLTWLAMFRYFAAHAGIDRDLKILALDRQGHYACRLIDRVPPDEWGKLVRLAHAFGITERELNALLQARHARMA